MSLLGRKVMQFEIRALLGSGGMGEVYEAIDPLLGVRVAVKALHPHLAVKKEQAARFLQEAIGAAAVQSASGRRNENIVNVLGRDEIDGRVVILLEFLEGCDLEIWLHRREQGGHGLLALDDVCRISLQLCYALDGVHRAGIVHRDLKPGNVHVLDDGPRRLFLKVLDFGIAKLRVDLRVTGVATLGPMGTLQYMAPEQANAPQHVDARADIWALGCILYRVLTGRAAFNLDEDDAWGVRLRAQQASGMLPAPPSSLRRDVGAEWDAIIARCLQPEPANRYPDVQMLAEDIIKAAPDDGPAVFAEVWPGGFISGPDARTVRHAAAAALAAARSTPPPPAPTTGPTVGSMSGAAGMVESRATARAPRWVWLAVGGALLAFATVIVASVRDAEPSPPEVRAAIEEGNLTAAASARAATSAESDASVPNIVDAAPLVDATAGSALGGAERLPVDAGRSPERRASGRRVAPERSMEGPADAGPSSASLPDAAPSRRRFNPGDVIRP